MKLGQVFARRRRRGALGRALAGLAAGAGLAYFLDPVRGPARRVFSGMVDPGALEEPHA